MRNSNLIQSDLLASSPSTLSIFFTLETKGMGGLEGGALRTEGSKAAEYLENFLMDIVWIDLTQKKYDHSVLC
jgi:hypothetical protein